MRTTPSLVLGLCALTVLPAGAADWSDTFLGYRHGSSFYEPANPAPIQKDIVQFTHASRYFLGSNFLNVDVFLSDATDPANGGSNPGGATEIYVTYRNQLNFSKLFKTDLKMGPIKDLSFTAGFDLNSKDTALAPRKRVLLAGPTVNFDLPKGFLDLGVWYYKEKNHNAFGDADRKQVTFDGALMLNATWGVPVNLGSLPTTFKGFVNYIGAKGLDAERHDTKPETLVRASWMLDLGSLVSARKTTLMVGPGYEYWNNKFGIPTVNGPFVNTRISCVTANVEFHF
jgi:nucleoside-specific outer membrane channel protein Tsx